MADDRAAAHLFYQQGFSHTGSLSDLHRHLLYQALRWDLPPDPDTERLVGQRLTEYLWRG